MSLFCYFFTLFAEEIRNCSIMCRASGPQSWQWDVALTTGYYYFIYQLMPTMIAESSIAVIERIANSQINSFFIHTCPPTTNSPTALAGRAERYGIDAGKCYCNKLHCRRIPRARNNMVQRRYVYDSYKSFICSSK